MGAFSIVDRGPSVDLSWGSLGGRYLRNSLSQEEKMNKQQIIDELFRRIELFENYLETTSSKTYWFYRGASSALEGFKEWLEDKSEKNNG